MGRTEDEDEEEGETGDDELSILKESEKEQVCLCAFPSDW